METTEDTTTQKSAGTTGIWRNVEEVLGVLTDIYMMKIQLKMKPETENGITQEIMKNTIAIEIKSEA